LFELKQKLYGQSFVVECDKLEQKNDNPPEDHDKKDDDEDDEVDDLDDDPSKDNHMDTENFHEPSTNNANGPKLFPALKPTIKILCRLHS